MYWLLNMVIIAFLGNSITTRLALRQSTPKYLSLVCGNKMPTRCNRRFYCSSYCLLNMFRGPLCPSSGAQEYYTVVAASGISCCGFQVAVWCGAEGYVSGLQDPAAKQHPANRTHNHRIILLSS